MQFSSEAGGTIAPREQGVSDLEPLTALWGSVANKIKG